MFSHLKKNKSAHYTNQKTILMISSEHLASYFYALGLSATMSMPIPDFSGCFVPTFEPVCNMLVIVLELMVKFVHNYLILEIASNILDIVLGILMNDYRHLKMVSNNLPIHFQIL